MELKEFDKIRFLFENYALMMHLEIRHVEAIYQYEGLRARLSPFIKQDNRSFEIILEIRPVKQQEFAARVE